MLVAVVDHPVAQVALAVVVVVVQAGLTVLLVQPTQAAVRVVETLLETTQDLQVVQV
jgi:hypothetical protein